MNRTFDFQILPQRNPYRLFYQRFFVRTAGLFFPILFCFSITLQAQIDEDDPYYTVKQGAFSLKGGMVQNSTSDLTRMLIPKEYDPSLYTTTEEPLYGAAVDFSFATRLPNSPLFIEPGLSFRAMGARLKYEDINQVRYAFTLDYQYLNFGLGFRYNPLLAINKVLGGIHLNLGAEYGIVVKDRIEYSSSPDSTDDGYQREELQSIFKAKGNFQVFGGIGYDYHWDNGFGLILNVRRCIGLSDVIETKPNGHYFSEQKNQTKSWAATIGITYAINPGD